MNPILMTGVCIVILALTSYSVAFISQMKTRTAGLVVRRYITIGVALDVISTSFMIAGSRKIPFTFHGLLGYSALVLMAIDMGLIWKSFRSRPMEMIQKKLRAYSILAYSWWVIAFLAGILITIFIEK